MVLLHIPAKDWKLRMILPAAWATLPSYDTKWVCRSAHTTMSYYKGNPDMMYVAAHLHAHEPLLLVILTLNHEFN